MLLRTSAESPTILWHAITGKHRSQGALGVASLASSTSATQGGSMPEPKSKRAVASLFSRPLLAGAMAAAVAPAPALADIFLNLYEFAGESLDSKHKGEIDILSYSQSFRAATSAVGGGGGTGKVTCGDVTLLKNIDKSSPHLIEHVVTGKHIEKGLLTFRTTGKTQVEYYTVTLTDILISSIDQSDQPDPAKIVERTTLTPAAFEFSYRPQNPNGSLGTAIHFKYDCKADKGV
jgi:type VI secretion system secreted protein Hcp